MVVLLLILPSVSFAKAMTYPGNASVSVRAVEWVRDHGGAGIVNTVESWYYAHHTPPRTGGPQDQVPAGPRPARARAADHLPRVRLVAGLPAKRDEGAWHAARTSRTGAVAMYTTWLRPDPRYRPVVAGAALLPMKRDALHLVGGTRQPVPGLTWPERYRVPPAARSRLVAAFNAGFKMADAHGGWYGDHRTAARLVDGAASLVISNDGSARVGVWGSDVGMGPGVVAVRQNLALVVRHGQPVTGLSSNAHGRWGSARSQFQYTWRSGIGTDSRGDLIYVAGKGLTLVTLSDAMARVGIQTGMELDIHPTMVTFNSFSPNRATGGLAGRKLLTSMTQPRRYLTADQRDFFYVTLRHGT